MQAMTTILADGDASGKLVILLIGLAVWGITSLGSMLKKATQQPKAPVRRNVPTPPPMPARAPVRKPQQSAAASAALMNMANDLAQAKRAAHPRQQPPRPAPPRPPAPPPAPVAAAKKDPAVLAVTPRHRAGDKPLAAAVSSRPRNSPGAKAADLRRWLSPSSLRKQFILTELLQPPISMREGKG